MRAKAQGNPLFIELNAGALADPRLDGAYNWISIHSDPNDWGQQDIDYFFQQAQIYPLKVAISDAYIGFNDTLASWGQHRIMNQNCGQTWLNTLARQGVDVQTYPAAQVPAIQLITWNDYEEGTEIETGIDNCVAVTASLVGGQLTWTISGSEPTLDHYTAFISTDGQNLMSLGDYPVGTHALDIAAQHFASGSYTLYVKAIGRPSFLNHMSNAVKYLSP